jgi:hypothetical protein
VPYTVRGVLDMDGAPLPDAVVSTAAAPMSASAHWVAIAVSEHFIGAKDRLQEQAVAAKASE